MADDRAKNVWTVFDPDGRISMSNKVFDDPDGRYGKVLAEREMNFVNHGGRSHANPGKHFVWKGRVEEMPKMPISINKVRIAVGENDAAKITGIPKGAEIVVTAHGYPDVLWHTVEETGAAELSVPAPGAYLVTITRMPFRQWRCIVSAAA